jgi:hypothetical protein
MQHSFERLVAWKMLIGKGKERLGKLDLDGMMILKCNYKEDHVRMWT